MKHIEIELRFEVTDIIKLNLFTEKLNFKNKKQDIDVYFDTNQADLLSKGIFIRMRNGRSVDIKFNRDSINDPLLPMQPYCEEYIFSYPILKQEYSRFNEIVISLGLNAVNFSDDFFEEFKKINKFNEHYRIEKTRTEYTNDIFTIAIDEVQNLGTFLEIECMTETKDHVKDIEAKMKQFIEPLMLNPLKTGYGTLYLRKNNFDHYLKSRFILKEDLIYRKNINSCSN